MKKLFSVMLAVLMLLSATAFAEGEYRVAMISDYADITDQSFNQTTCEACKAFCEARGVPFTYFKPNTDTTPDRVAMVEKADDEGYNVIVLPGFAFGETIAEVQGEYPNTIFIALEVTEADLGGASLGSNVYSANYKDEQGGFMAGYAAVKMGYTHLGYLGGMAVPAVVRRGYGFVQGADAAAKELGITDQVKVEYVYGNQFVGDADITAYMDTWYQKLGVQCVFACGGGIYTSAAEAAAKVGGKVIGVDTDQSVVIDPNYGEGMTVTSAMKGLAVSVNTMLSEVLAGNFANYGGKMELLGVVSEDPEANYVSLSPTTRFNDSFTQEDYKAMVSRMFKGEITVSDAIDAEPQTAITVNYLGTVK